MRRQTAGTATFSLISSVCVVAVSAILLRLFFRDSPPPDFADLYLLCVLGVAYRYPWKFAAALAAVTLAVSIYLLAPLDWLDGFQLASYAVCATVVIWIMACLRRPAPRTS